jgi:hypothetical protein
MYHSEPALVDLNVPTKNKMVIAQYHATLDEFSDCTIVRNVIDFNQPLYNPIYGFNEIRIGYSPSRKTKMGKWHDKGYNETLSVLTKTQNMYPNVIIDVITDVSLEECLMRKNQCNVIIDECVTGSYHRSGLEGLALGKFTICYLSQGVQKVIKRSSGSSKIPFSNVHISHLEKELITIIKKGVSYIESIGEENRKWMERNWHPSTIVNEYVNFYEQVK